MKEFKLIFMFCFSIRSFAHGKQFLIAATPIKDEIINSGFHRTFKISFHSLAFLLVDNLMPNNPQLFFAFKCITNA
jgi:hypothetical protein